MKNRESSFYNKLFVPFIEGRVSYDCQACDGYCCKQGNLFLNNKERKMFLILYPHLKYFSFMRTAKRYGVKKFTNCWFLEKDGTCNIHNKYGYMAKPIICRMHPFSLIKCGSEYIIKTAECPRLRVNRTGNGIRYKPLLQNALEKRRLGMVNERISLSTEKLKVEKDILTGSKRYLRNKDYLDFAAFQLKLTAKNIKIKEIKQELLKQLMLWKSFLGIEELNIENPEVTYELTVLTSLLRLEPFLLSEKEERSKILALLALYLFMLLYLKVRNTERFYDTYKFVLRDMARGLPQIKNEDVVALMKKPVEDRIYYLSVLKEVARVGDKT